MISRPSSVHDFLNLTNRIPLSNWRRFWMKCISCCDWLLKYHGRTWLVEIALSAFPEYTKHNKRKSLLSQHLIKIMPTTLICYQNSTAQSLKNKEILFSFFTFYQTVFMPFLRWSESDVKKIKVKVQKSFSIQNAGNITVTVSHFKNITVSDSDISNINDKNTSPNKSC